MSDISQELSENFMKHEVIEDVAAEFIIDDDDPVTILTNIQCSNKFSVKFPFKGFKTILLNRLNQYPEFIQSNKFKIVIALYLNVH